MSQKVVKRNKWKHPGGPTAKGPSVLPSRGLGLMPGQIPHAATKEQMGQYMWKCLQEWVAQKECSRETPVPQKDGRED